MRLEITSRCVGFGGSRVFVSSEAGGVLSRGGTWVNLGMF